MTTRLVIAEFRQSHLDFAEHGWNGKVVVGHRHMDTVSLSMERVAKEP